MNELLIWRLTQLIGSIQKKNRCLERNLTFKFLKFYQNSSYDAKIELEIETVISYIFKIDIFCIFVLYVSCVYSVVYCVAQFVFPFL